MIELLNINCLDYMATLEDKAFDLAIVDPPYGIGEDGGKSQSRCNATGVRASSFMKKGWDNSAPNSFYFDELQRVSKNQIIWGANHFLGKTSSCWIVWDKDNGDNDFADCELAYTSFNTAVRKFRYKWHGMLQEDMKDKEVRIHPTQKPIKLYKWLLNNYAKPGDRILDTHGGSMSIAIACHQMGFELTLCEIDKDYYEAGVKRYNEAIKQQTLFSYDSDSFRLR